MHAVKNVVSPSISNRVITCHSSTRKNLIFNYFLKFDLQPWFLTAIGFSCLYLVIEHERFEYLRNYLNRTVDPEIVPFTFGTILFLTFPSMLIVQNLGMVLIMNVLPDPEKRDPAKSYRVKNFALRYLKTRVTNGTIVLGYSSLKFRELMNNGKLIPKNWKSFTVHHHFLHPTFLLDIHLMMYIS